MIGPAWEAQFTSKEQVQTVLLDTLYIYLHSKQAFCFTSISLTCSERFILWIRIIIGLSIWKNISQNI